MTSTRLVQLLENLVRDVQFSGENNKQEGIQNLARILREEADLREAAPALLGHENWRVRYLTIRAMEMADHPGLNQGLDALAEDDSPEVRATVKRLQQKNQDSTQPGLEDLISLLAHPSWWVRKKAVLGLGTMGNDQVKRALMEHLSTESDEEVKLLAGGVLSDLRQASGV